MNQTLCTKHNSDLFIQDKDQHPNCAVGVLTRYFQEEEEEKYCSEEFDGINIQKLSLKQS